jgi:hypothetical protein
MAIPSGLGDFGHGDFGGGLRRSSLCRFSLRCALLFFDARVCHRRTLCGGQNASEPPVVSIEMNTTVQMSISLFRVK